MSSSALWNGTSVFSRVKPRRGSALRGLAQGGSGSLVYLGVGLLLGLIIGLPVLGWWVWPVQVENAAPADLAPAYQQAYVAMAADSYALNGDADLARARLGTWDADDIAAILAGLEAETQATGSQVQAKRLSQLHEDLGLAAGTSAALSAPDTAAETDDVAQPAAAAGASRFGTWPILLALVVFAGAGLLVGGYVLYRQASLPSLAGAIAKLRSVNLPRPKLPSLRRAARASPPVRAQVACPPTATATIEQEDDEGELTLDEAFDLLNEDLAVEPDEGRATTSAPLAGFAADSSRVVGNFIATYRHGAGEGFDTSFSIETEDGEFLGECGVGVAETVGDASPQRACAMEVWLFDKSDIRTTTKLIVSDFAAQNSDLRDALAGRGEVVRAQGGQTIKLESAGLTLAVQVTNLKYCESAEAAPRSYFEEVAMELTALQK